VQERPKLKTSVPGPGYHRDLISCQVGCPVHTDSRAYVRAIAEGRFEEAYLISRGPNPLASTCGRVCGAPCEIACRRGKIPRVDREGRYIGDDLPIAIRALKRFACEQAGYETRPANELLESVRKFVPPLSAGVDEMAALLHADISGRFIKADGQKIAIIGSGPAGLAAGHDLALMGFQPTIFESEHIPSGMLVLGVPPYRLDPDLIRWEIEVVQAVGVEIRCDMRVGKDILLSELREEYDAVIIAVGAQGSRHTGVPGEQGPHVYGGVDILRKAALGESLDLGSEAVVIGGGNVAYDVARSVLRQVTCDTARTVARMPGVANVHLVSLETLEEMPADTMEIVDGDEEGVQRHNGWGPVEVLRDGQGKVEGVKFKRCTRVYDEETRFAPEFDEEDILTIPCDTVLLSVGQSTDLQLLEGGGEDVELFRPGWPTVDQETLQSTAPGVFVAGDLAYGTKLIIDAVASGKKAARSIYKYVTGREIDIDAVTAFTSLDPYRREQNYEKEPRVHIPMTSPEERMERPDILAEIGYNEKQAMREGGRCLECGVTPVFDGVRCILCGGCVDVCPTLCLKIVPLSELASDEDTRKVIEETLGPDADLEGNSAILKDEDRCIRCALCEIRCPVAAISMERANCDTRWSTT
jgi:formate dehydrogenase (NADP+) beta subunit